MGILTWLSCIVVAFLMLWGVVALVAWVDRRNPLIRPDGRLDDREWWSWFAPVLASAVLVWMVWMLAHLPGVP